MRRLREDGLPADHDSSQHIVTATASTGRDCGHRNGIYFTVKCWIFTKRYFFCEDCRRPILASEVQCTKNRPTVGGTS